MEVCVCECVNSLIYEAIKLIYLFIHIAICHDRKIYLVPIYGHINRMMFLKSVRASERTSERVFLPVCFPSHSLSNKTWIFLSKLQFTLDPHSLVRQMALTNNFRFECSNLIHEIVTVILLLLITILHLSKMERKIFQYKCYRMFQICFHIDL